MAKYIKFQIKQTKKKMKKLNGVLLITICLLLWYKKKYRARCYVNHVLLVVSKDISYKNSGIDSYKKKLTNWTKIHTPIQTERNQILTLFNLKYKMI